MSNHSAPVSRRRRAKAWLRAARPHAQANIALPIALGVAAAVGTGAALEGWMLAACAAFSVLDQLFIVFANDYADRHTDSAARTWVSGGSGVLVDGSLSPAHVRRAALAHLVGLLVLALVLVTRRPWMIAASLSAIVLMQLYSYAPVRLSHRGGGEWLQGAGIGLVLPWVGFYLVTGDPRAPLAILLPMVLFGVAGNISTAVPDLAADRAVGKRTLPVVVGDTRARIAGVFFLLCAMVLAAWLARGELSPMAQGLMASAALPWLLHLGLRAPLAYALIQGVSMTLWLLAFAWGLVGG
ncbi:MAG: prenyltransferase [Deltaproteobacteria bacterium]|nr:prenyltransferase [Deltaproteobacteria bacterium]